MLLARQLLNYYNNASIWFNSFRNKYNTAETNNWNVTCVHTHNKVINNRNRNENKKWPQGKISMKLRFLIDKFNCIWKGNWMDFQFYLIVCSWKIRVQKGVFCFDLEQKIACISIWIDFVGFHSFDWTLWLMAKTSLFIYACRSA